MMFRSYSANVRATGRYYKLSFLGVFLESSNQSRICLYVLGPFEVVVQMTPI
jgi:hypothetical protein